LPCKTLTPTQVEVAVALVVLVAHLLADATPSPSKLS